MPDSFHPLAVSSSSLISFYFTYFFILSLLNLDCSGLVDWCCYTNSIKVLLWFKKGEKEVDFHQLNWFSYFVLQQDLNVKLIIWEFFMGNCYCVITNWCKNLIFRVRQVRMCFHLNGIMQRRKFLGRRWRLVFIYIPRSCQFYLYFIIHQHPLAFDLNLFYIIPI